MSSAATYVRRTNPKLTFKLWDFLDESETGRSSAEIIEQFGEKVLSNASQDKLVVIGTTDESRASVLSNMVKPRTPRFRYRPSYDRSRFGDVSHDWFCFHCHDCREDNAVVGCKTCFRSFHPNCLLKDGNRPKKTAKGMIICVYCLKRSQVDQSLKVNRISRSEKNRLFAMVLRKLEDSIPGFDIYDGYKMGPNPKTKVLIFKYLDLNDIRRKILSEKYENIYELENDFKHFVHNFMVFRITGLSQQFEPYLRFVFTALKNCSDCFDHYFNRGPAKELSHCFVQLCDPPHRVVYCKTGADPFWPAKLIRRSESDKCLIQFFAPNYFTELMFEEVNNQTIRTIDFKFERKWYSYHRGRPFLEIVAKHLRDLVDRGVNPNNEYSNALEIFAKHNIWNTYVPQKSAKNTTVEPMEVTQTVRPKRLPESIEQKKSKAKKSKKSKEPNPKRIRKVSFDMTEAESYSQTKELSSLSSQLSNTSGESYEFSSESEPYFSQNSVEVSYNYLGQQVLDDFDDRYDIDSWTDPCKVANTGNASDEWDDPDMNRAERSLPGFDALLASDVISDEEKFRFCTAIIEMQCKRLSLA